MTQPSNSHHLTASSSQTPSPDSSHMVDNFAENLMDDLFDGVDRILEGDLASHNLPDQMADPMTAVLPGEIPVFDADTLTLPAMLVPTSSTEAADDSDDDAPKADTAKPESKSKFKQVLPKVAVGAACLSGLIALGFWAARTQTQTAVAPTPDPTNVEAAPAVSEEVAFGQYLQRSLNLIDGQQQAQQGSTSVLAAGAPPNLPTNTSNVVPGNGNNRPNIIERVFVPVFQSNQTAANQTAVNRPTLPSPNQSAGRLPSPNQQATAPNNGAATTAPAPNTTTALVPNISPVNTHMLVGVLELGDRSAALFEVNGIPQRVYVGERVGSTDWNVVSVANQEVVVRRNGEVRSIYIGQQF